VQISRRAGAKRYAGSHLRLGDAARTTRLPRRQASSPRRSTDQQARMYRLCSDKYARRFWSRASTIWQGARRGRARTCGLNARSSRTLTDVVAKRGRHGEQTLQFSRSNAPPCGNWRKAPSARLRALACCDRWFRIPDSAAAPAIHYAQMLAAGFNVRATDGSPEWLMSPARRLGHPRRGHAVRSASTAGRLEGVWARLLLHAPGRIG